MRSLTALLVLGCGSGAHCQDASQLDARRITSGEFRAQRFGPARWLDGKHFATLEHGANGVPEFVRYEAVSGAREVLVTAAMLEVPSEGRSLRIEDYAFSPDGARLMVYCDTERVWRVNTRGEYYVLPLDGSAPPRRLGGDLPKSKLMFAKFSPDGSRAGYVCENDIYVEDVATGEQTRLTDSGSETIINGTFDWVYEEEFDCQDGFRWSPDGTRIAYWQLDCSGVGTFLMIDNLSDRYAQVVPVQYPKAGTTNSSCRVGVIPATGGETVWMQTPGDPRETYVPRMEWHPGGEELMLQWLPRAQNHLVIYAADAVTGALRMEHQERDEAYVDVREDFRWIGNGEHFLWTSDVSQKPSKRADLETRRAYTARWDLEGWRQEQPGVVDEFIPMQPLTPYGVDVIAIEWAQERDLYFSGSPDNATQKYLFAADGTRLTPADQPGWHEYQVSADGSLAIHTWSRMDQAPLIDLVRLPSHERVRVLVDNEDLRARYDALEMGAHEFFEVTTEDGHTLDGWVLYPAGFDATKRWPVVCHVYNEPWSQTVKDVWPLRHHLFHVWLTQQGYVVLSVDGRGTPAPKGRDWRKALYQNIGVVSSHDWNQAMQALLAKHGWMDRDRLAIWGWSGGGAMTLNMLFRYPDLFACGMSVAPVTDIRLYDTIYQERYCGDPRQFPEVYERCSPIQFAENLTGDLLLVHGTADDNVHFQNSERLFDKLVAHGKLFEYLAYPNRTHAIRERANTSAHLYASLADFVRRRMPSGAR